MDLDITPSELEEMVLTSKNPSAIGVRRIKNTTAAIVLFSGQKVPRYVRVGMSIHNCSLYRRQLDVCYACGQLGHRADVCPNPEKTICRGCGTSEPAEDHQCTPKCSLCGGPHPTADKACQKRFQVPYIVKQRRRERQLQAKDFPSLDPPKEPRGRSQTRGRSTSKARKDSPRSLSRRADRSNSRPARVRLQSPDRPSTRSWAEKVKTTPKQVKGGITPEHTSNEREVELLRMIEQLRAEVRELRKAEEKKEPNTAKIALPEKAPETDKGAGNPSKKLKRAEEEVSEIQNLRRDMMAMFQQVNENIMQLTNAVSTLNSKMEEHDKRIINLEQHILAMQNPNLPEYPEQPLQVRLGRLGNNQARTSPYVARPGRTTTPLDTNNGNANSGN